VHWWILAILARFFPRGHLGRMYAAWALAMVIMYPLCLAWGRFMAGRPPDSQGRRGHLERGRPPFVPQRHSR
jgi:drug/metabolite transporter superfamily protein YnfA